MSHQPEAPPVDHEFFDLDSQDQKDLIEWYNVQEDCLKSDDYDRLLELFNDGRFRAWDCPECGDRVFEGRPDNWDNFQGTLNQDFSFFGNRDKFTEDYINDLCDHCRCYA